MAGYTLERFGTVTLPIYNPESDHSPLHARTAVIQTIAGAFDGWGDEDAPLELPATRSYRCVVLEESYSAWRTALDELRALVGKRAKLYRRANDDDSIQWCTARLLQNPTQRRYGSGLAQEVELVFQLWSGWHGQDHKSWKLDEGYFLDDGLYLDDGGFTETMASSPHTITVTNGGNRRVDDAVITITAGSSSITAVTIAKTGETDIDYGGIISSTKTLVIDCGAYTVKDDGVSDYANFSLASNHKIAEWLRLDPGDNDIIITFSGGSTNSTVNVQFRDGWA